MPSSQSAPVDFPVLRTCPFEPPKAYRALEDDAPLARVRLFDGTQAWVVTGHAEVREVLGSEIFSSDRTNPGFPFMIPTPPEARSAKNLITLDPPEHTERRRMLMSAFSPRRLRALTPWITETAERLAADMAAGPQPADLVQSFSLPLASYTICLLLGVPAADREYFEQRSRQLISPEDPSQVGAIYAELLGYMGELVTRKSAEPGDDIISMLITEQLTPGNITHAELVETAFLLLAAGHATSAAMITIGTALLLRNPEQLQRLLKDRTLMPTAIEELLRLLTVADLTAARVATADVEIGGQLIKAGEGVIPALALANRDPKVFPDPDALDLDRAAAHTHLAFGHGSHLCIGSNLARIELEVAYSTLFDRLPELRLADPDQELAPAGGSLLPDIPALPVCW